MSHFVVWVIGGDIDEQLAPYSEELRVAPYKVRMDKEDLQRMFDHYKMKGTESEETILKKILDWNGCKAGKDRFGYFYWSRYNQDSKWDWYEVGGRWENEIITKSGEKVNEASKGDIDFTKTDKPFAVIKDGIWHESGKMGWWGVSTKNKAKKTWEQIVDDLLNNTPEDEMITIVDCHI